MMTTQKNQNEVDLPRRPRVTDGSGIIIRIDNVVVVAFAFHAARTGRRRRHHAALLPAAAAAATQRQGDESRSPRLWPPSLVGTNEALKSKRKQKGKEK